MSQITELKGMYTKMMDEVNNGNVEIAHANADELLIDALRYVVNAGVGRDTASIVGRIIEAYRDVPKWYA